MLSSRSVKILVVFGFFGIVKGQRYVGKQKLQFLSFVFVLKTLKFDIKLTIRSKVAITSLFVVFIIL